MTEVVDSGVPTAAHLAAVPWAEATLIFDPVSDDAGRLLDLRCTSLDEGARLLLTGLEKPVLLLGRGGEGPLDLAACAAVLQTGRERERELVVGRGRTGRHFSATLSRHGPALALSLREVTQDRGNRRLPRQPRRTPWRLDPLRSEQPEAHGAPDGSAALRPPMPSPASGPAIWEWFPREGNGAWSDGAQRLLNLQGPLEPSPQGLYRCVDPRDRESVAEALERALACGGGFSVRCRSAGFGAPGVELTLAGRVDPVEGRGPRLVAVLGEARAGGDAQGGSQRERILREVTREVVWEWSADPDEVVWGETLRPVLGWDHGAARDKAWRTRALHPEDRDRVLSSLERATREGASRWTEEYRVARADGSWAPVRERGWMERDPDGRLLRMVGCIADLTEVRAEEQERQREARFRERFIGILGHDLRTPLNAISLSAQTLRRRTALTETQREVVGRIQSSTARMERMITEILDLTRARLAGGIPVRPASCDVHALSRRVLKELKAVHPERTFGFEVRGPGQASVDAERLAQAVGNLISNAVQHSPPGLPIEVESHTTEGTWHLRVHNWGPPIAAERLSEIFHPFRSGSTHSSLRLGAGLGLGLYIVREVAQAHGGRVAVESTLEEGTRFILSLPLQPSAKAGREVPRAAAERRHGDAAELTHPRPGEWAQ